MASGPGEKPAPCTRISWEGRAGTGEGATIICSMQPLRCCTPLGPSVPPRPSGSLVPNEGPDELAPRTPPQYPHTELPVPSRGWGPWALLHPTPTRTPTSGPFLLQGPGCSFPLSSNDVICFLHATYVNHSPLGPTLWLWCSSLGAEGARLRIGPQVPGERELFVYFNS